MGISALESILNSDQSIKVMLFGCGLYATAGYRPNEMVVDEPWLTSSEDEHCIQCGDIISIDKSLLVPNTKAADFTTVSKNFKKYVSEIYETPLTDSLDQQNQLELPVITHGRFTAPQAFRFDIVLAGAVVKFKDEDLAMNFLMEKVGEGLAETLQDVGKAHLHPFYPTYAVPTATFRNSCSDQFIPFCLFNCYGEFIGNQEYEVEAMAITSVEQDIIPDLGLSPSLDEFSREYELEHI